MELDKVILENNRTKIEAKLRDGTILFQIIGFISEDVNFGDLIYYISECTGEPILKIKFDLNDLTGLNSCGVREWLLFIEKIEQKYVIEFKNLNEVFIELSSTVGSMFGKKKPKVLSFYVPYFCPKCMFSFNKLINKDLLDIVGEKPMVPECKCPKCGAKTDFDSIEADYFKFLKNTD